MKKKIVRLLLFIYKNCKKSDLLKKVIKRIIGEDKIKVSFNGFLVQAGIRTSIESGVFFDNYNEVMVLELIKSYASKGYNFIDAGANIGLHSLTAANSNPDIEIYSFEPELFNYQQFVKNIILNDFVNIRPFKMGLGNLSDNKILNINEGWNKGKHSLKNNFAGSQKKINIPITTIDVFKYNINCNNLIIKIDVEGYEKEVIDGAESICRQTQNCIVIIELLEENNGLSICNEITHNLKNNNFNEIYKIIDDTSLCKVDNFKGSGDYVFLKGLDAKKNIENYTI
ncbi:FkbM family methyltransferase [Flavobacterium sp.]|uniref:FkbM family methyltransferase n=1 Tax=Flavobacterium sp. TaxID=239 RepID=UPI0032678A73